jgi:hypothetical protein
VPYFEDIFKTSGNEDMVRTNGYYYGFNTTAREYFSQRSVKSSLLEVIDSMSIQPQQLSSNTIEPNKIYF